jgi:hypothetical protein
MTTRLGLLYTIYFQETNEIYYLISVKKQKKIIKLIQHNPTHILYERVMTKKYVMSIVFTCEITKGLTRWNFYPLKSERISRIVLNEPRNIILNKMKRTTINIKRISTIKEPSQKYLNNKDKINDYAMDRYYKNKEEILRNRKLCHFNCICGVMNLNWYYRLSHFNTDLHKINLRLVLGLDTSEFTIPKKKGEKRQKEYIDCECSKKYEKYSRESHMRSQFHQNFIHQKYGVEIVVKPTPKIPTEKKKGIQ